MKIVCIIFFVVLIGSCAKDIDPEINNLTYFDLGISRVSTMELTVPSFVFPIKDKYRISSNFGNRDVIIQGMGGEEGDFHRGIDIVSKPKAEVIAAASGIVHLHYPPPNNFYKGHPVFGGMIVINHGNDVYSLYGHLGKTFVKEGQFITQGTKIGLVGNTGLSTGPHLHFEVIFNPFSLLTNLK